MSRSALAVVSVNPWRNTVMVMRSRVWNIRGLVAGIGLVMGAVAVTDPA